MGGGIRPWEAEKVSNAIRDRYIRMQWQLRIVGNYKAEARSWKSCAARGVVGGKWDERETAISRCTEEHARYRCSSSTGTRSRKTSNRDSSKLRRRDRPRRVPLRQLIVPELRASER